MDIARRGSGSSTAGRLTPEADSLLLAGLLAIGAAVVLLWLVVVGVAAIRAARREATSTR